MQLTIDSTEPIEQVLLVVGSLYGVQLSVAPGPSRVPASKKAGKSPTTVLARKRQPAKKSTRAARTSATDRPAAVREWARANGHAVADRGRVPRAVVAAFQKSR